MTPLEALSNVDKYLTKYFNRALNRPEDTLVKWAEIDIIENALNNYEWLLSKLDLDFIDRLNTEDRIRLAKMYGVKIDYE